MDPRTAEHLAAHLLSTNDDVGRDFGGTDQRPSARFGALVALAADITGRAEYDIHELVDTAAQNSHRHAGEQLLARRLADLAEGA